MREVSKGRMRRYMVLRLCFRCDRDFDELVRETGLREIEMVNTIQYLRRNRLLEKETNERGVIVYSLTARGEERLAHYEFNFACYQKWKPKWCEGENNNWDDEYCREMSELIRRLDYFGYENVVNAG